MYIHNYARLSIYASFWRKASTVAVKKNKSQLKIMQREKNSSLHTVSYYFWIVCIRNM